MRLMIIIALSVMVFVLGAISHEFDMLKDIDRGYIYTWTKGKIPIVKTK